MTTRRAKLAGGITMVVVACAAMLATVRVFDRTATARTVAAAPLARWRLAPGTAAASLSLGAVVLPPAGGVRAIVCPTPLGDPYARLQVTDAATRKPIANEALALAEARGGRCFEALYRRAAVDRVVLALVVPSSAVARRVQYVDVSVSRRITPVAALPVVVLLAGFVLMGTALAERRSRSPAPDGASGGPIEQPRERSSEDRSQHETTASTAEIAPRPPVLKSWSPALALLAYLGVHIATQVVATIYLGVTGSAALTTGTFVAVTLLVQHALLALVAVWFLGGLRSDDAGASLGITAIPRADVARAVGLALGLVLLAAGSTRLIRDVSVSPMGRMIEWVPVRYAIGFGALVAPVSEELFFRGVLVRAFGKRSITLGVVLSAAVFTLAHAVQLEGAWFGLAPIAGVALVNGWLRARTGGIAQSWLVHTIYNSALSVGLYLG